MAWGLWQTYGPTIVAKGAALVAAASAASANQAQNANRSRGVDSASASATGYVIPDTPPASSSSASDTASVLERRRQLEAELASLPLPSTIPVLTPAANNAYPPRAPGSESESARRRVASGSSSSSESLSAPSSTNVLEGLTTVGAASVYLSANPDSTGRYERISREDADTEDESPKTPPAATGWFGWGRSNSGYERLKNE